MKKLAAELLFGKNARFSGLIAFIIVGAIALGCTCGKELGNLGKDDDSTTASNTSSTSEPSDAPVKKANASTGQVPSNDQLQDLAKTTILDFNDALQSKDFTGFHRNISKPFQEQVSAERFKQVFKAFIDAGVDFEEVRSLNTNFTSPATIERSVGGKQLILNGNYATSPRRTNFALKYITEKDEWKLIAIEIDTKN